MVLAVLSGLIMLGVLGFFFGVLLNVVDVTYFCYAMDLDAGTRSRCGCAWVNNGRNHATPIFPPFPQARGACGVCPGTRHQHTGDSSSESRWQHHVWCTVCRRALCTPTSAPLPGRRLAGVVKMLFAVGFSDAWYCSTYAIRQLSRSESCQGLKIAANQTAPC